MRCAARITLAALIASLPLVGTGCIPQDKYDQALMANRTLKEQLLRAENERDAALANFESALSEVSGTRFGVNDLQSQNLRLQGDLDELAADYDELLQRVSSLQMGPLPEEVENALVRVAAAYPDILTFDERQGMLRFASDLTFNSGKAELTPEAAQTIAAVASILRSGKAASLEVRVVGHTDNVPIKASASRHPSNVHLSVNRAIAVREVLASSGVDSVRIQVAGYGEFRPLVPNQPGGTMENRRVEIFLAPMPALASFPTSGVRETTVITETQLVEEDTDEPMK